jgi:hypothetical protein
MEQVLIPVIAVIIVIAIAAMAYLLYRKTRRRAAALAATLGLDDMKSGQSYEGETHGRKFFYEYYAGSKNNPSYFKIWIDCPGKGDFRIGRESAMDRLFKRLGITVEIQTGDRQFDRDYYINTDSAAFTRACFSSPERRQAVNELFKLNFKKIAHNGNRLEIKITPFTFTEGFDKTTIESAVTQLVAMERELPEDYYEPRVIGTPAWKFKRAVIYTVSITSIVAGFTGLVWGNASYAPLDAMAIFKDSLGHSVPAFVIFTVVSILFLKGRSSSHVDLLVNLCIAMIGIPLITYAGMVVANGYLDKTPANYHEVMAVNKRYTRSKDSTTYYVKLESWRENHAREEIKVNKHSYDKIHDGMTVMGITTRPGYLGYEWLVAYRIVTGDR